MNVVSTPQGPVSYADDEVIVFPEGLFGFEDLHRFIRVPAGADSIFSYLQSLDEAEIAFVVCEPRQMVEGYQLTIPRVEAESMGLLPGDEPRIFGICTVPEKIENITVNLLGPLVIHPRSRSGRQVIDQNPAYSTRHRLFAEAALQAQEAG